LLLYLKPYMVARHVIDRIVEFNRDRLPEGIKRKYNEMSINAFSFLRGTCHLFYEDLPRDHSLFTTPPLVWSCGDLHLQNFGSYKGEDRLVYFDINDFDESLLAPASWDLARCLTSLHLAADTLELAPTAAQTLCQNFLTRYTTALAEGKARTIHRETAKGLVSDLLETLLQRDRAPFLDKRSRLSGKTRTLKPIDGKTSPIPIAEATWVNQLIQTWANTQPDPDFYEVLDVMHRIAGNGSLGLERYLILVTGKGSPDKNYLLDLKAARPSSIAPNCSQPQWPSAADRIVSIQQRFQESPPALLHALTHNNNSSYILRELQPSADKIDLADHSGKFKRYDKLVQTMAEVVAWGQLRSSGRQGSAIADDLITFAQTNWQQELLDYAQNYAQQVREDYQTFQTWHNSQK
jgi:uncharacterized protein (DUF2252 family)